MIVFAFVFSPLSRFYNQPHVPSCVTRHQCSVVQVVLHALLLSETIKGEESKRLKDVSFALQVNIVYRSLNKTAGCQSQSYSIYLYMVQVVKYFCLRKRTVCLQVLQLQKHRGKEERPVSGEK